ncbi:hypothetical protein T08_2929 [Trichinella sp. T8]|nr:hypothetical protein T08_2929 [Trichinella sp. T8]
MPHIEQMRRPQTARSRPTAEWRNCCKFVSPKSTGFCLFNSHFLKTEVENRFSERKVIIQCSVDVGRGAKSLMHAFFVCYAYQL